MNKRKIDKLDFKIKILSVSKDTIRVKRQHTEWAKIFANHISDEDLLSRMYKEHLKLNKDKQPNLKMGKEPEETFFQRGYTNGKQVYEKDAQCH